MANYLDPKNIKDAFVTAERHMKPYFQPVPEYERLARNKPHPKVVAMKLPNVTDGRLAAAGLKQPKRVIQQLPVGNVKSPQFPEMAKIINYDWQHNIIPHARTNGPVLLKSWTVCTKALTYGYQPTLQFMSSNGIYVGGDFRLPYVQDVLLPQGTVYGPDARIVFVINWWTKQDVQYQLSKEHRLKQTNPDYESGWDSAVLELLMEAMDRKPSDKQGAAEREKSDDSSFVKLVACYQEGIGNEFYMYSPKLDKIVRTWPNPDPRGQIPVKFMYADIDLSNPMGRGNIELAGGMQNLLDSEMQAYQFMQRLMMNPPLLKYGNSVVAQTVKWKPNAIWNMGSDVNSKLEPVPMNTQALANFGSNYQLIASEIDQLVGNSSNSISASAGNPSSSKTSQGVKESAANLSIDDNFLRKQYESWYTDMAGDVLNLTYAQKSANETIDLPSEFIASLSQDFTSKAIDINPKDGTGTIKYGLFTDAIKYATIDGSSKADDDMEQIDALTTLVTEASQNQYLNYYMGNDGYELHLGEAYKQLFMRRGIHDIDKIVTRLPIDPATGKPQPSGAVTPTFDKPIVRINYQDLAPAAQASALQNAGIEVQDPQQLLQPNMHQQMEAHKAQISASASAQGGAEESSEDPIKKSLDLDAMYKTTTSPQIRAQIETMAGLTPDIEHTTNEMDTAELENAATQAEAIHRVDPSAVPLTQAEQSKHDLEQQKTLIAGHQAESSRITATKPAPKPVAAKPKAKAGVK